MTVGAEYSERRTARRAADRAAGREAKGRSCKPHLGALLRHLGIFGSPSWKVHGRITGLHVEIREIFWRNGADVADGEVAELHPP